MNTIEFHVILTVGEARTVWTHATRDLALARITALLVHEPTLKVTEHPRARVQFTPNERNEHVYFEVTPSPHGPASALDFLDDFIEKTVPDLDKVPTKLGEVVQPHVVAAFAAMTERANISGFNVTAPSPHYEIIGARTKQVIGCTDSPKDAREDEPEATFLQVRRENCRNCAEERASATLFDSKGGDREVSKPEQLPDFVRELNAAAETWVTHYRGDKEGHPHGAFIDGYMHALGWRLDAEGKYVSGAQPHPRASANIESLIGSPGWKKGVLDCIDKLVAHQKNTAALVNLMEEMTPVERGARMGMLDAVIAMLQALYNRDARP